MEPKLFERTRLQTKKIRFSSNAPEIGRILFASDLNGCVLVIPELLGMRKNICVAKEGLPSTTVEP